MASFQIVPVTDRRTRKAFLKTLSAVMANDPAFIAPLAIEASQKLDPKRHPFYQHGEAAFWVALDDRGRPVGRISAQINRRHQARHGAKDGHFGCLAAIDDPAVFAGLFEVAEAWLKEQGADCAIGPASLSINEEIGLLVDGFETPPMLLMGHDPIWAGAHVEAAGYGKAHDLIAYSYDPSEGAPKRLASYAAKLKDVPGAKLRTFDKRNFNRDLSIILRVFNDAWSENWGFVPMSEGEINGMAHAFKALADYGLIFIIEIDDEPAGMAVSLPNVNETLRGLNGAGGPLALLRFLWRLKVGGVSSARVLLMGVTKAVQSDLVVGSVVGLSLVEALISAHAAKGYKTMELSWVLEDNGPMRRVAEVGGAEHYKTYRVYRKDLA
ncbi:MAG: dATP pyrophosphohydrolase [Alphaproteobacteria bacterium]